MSFLSGRTSLTTVQSGNIAADAITSAKIADDAIDSEHYTDASVDLAHMSSQAVDEDNLHISNSGSNGQFLSKQSGDAGGLTWAAAGGGSWTLIGTSEASDSATLDQTGLDSTYDTYAVALSDLVPATDDVDAWLRLGDSSGVDSGASDYRYHHAIGDDNTTSYAAENSTGAAQLKIGGKAGDDNSIGSDAGQGFGALIFIHAPGDGTVRSVISGTGIAIRTGNVAITHTIGGQRAAVITLDRVQFLFESGNVATGRMTVWGIAHA